MSARLDLADALPAGEQILFSEQMTYEPDSRVVRAARQFVLAKSPTLSQDTRDTLALLTSELVTNAVIHARTAIEVGIAVSEHHVLVSVHDLDIGHVEAKDGRDGGWGLDIVRTLAEHAAMTRHAGGGKTAWFRIARDG